MPDAQLGSGSVSDPLSPAQTKSDTVEDITEDQQTTANSRPSSQPSDVDNGSAFPTATNSEIEALIYSSNIVGAASATQEKEAARARDSPESSAGRTLETDATTSELQSGACDLLLSSSKITELQQSPALSFFDKSYEHEESETPVYHNRSGLGFGFNLPPGDMTDFNKDTTNFLGASTITQSGDNSADGANRCRESAGFVPGGYLPGVSDDFPLRDTYTSSTTEEKAGTVKESLITSSEAVAAASSCAVKSLATDAHVTGRDTNQKGSIEENEGDSNLNMNVNPIYDTSSLNSSSALSGVPPCHPLAANVALVRRTKVT